MIPNYRVPIFNHLATQCTLSIAAEKFEDDQSFQFNTIPIKLIQRGPFTLVDKFDKININKYEVVIFLFNIRFLNLIRLLMSENRNYKLLLWGIGVSSENGYDNNHKFDQIRYWAAKKADAVVFYSPDPINKYVKAGVDKEKLFVAHNTLDLKAKYFDDPKEYFLFVGALKKYKKIDHLIDIYYDAYNKYPGVAPLHIVGDGDFMEALRKQITDLGLSKKVTLYGAIHETAKLEKIYAKAIASISPSQAGLSVLQSLSMGVPFITNHDSITGGERFNVKNGYNGYLVKSDGEWSDLFIDLSKHSEKTSELGKNAYQYFNNHCSIDNMIDGFLDAIKFVLK